VAARDGDDDLGRAGAGGPQGLELDERLVVGLRREVPFAEEFDGFQVAGVGLDGLFEAAEGDVLLTTTDLEAGPKDDRLGAVGRGRAFGGHGQDLFDEGGGAVGGALVEFDPRQGDGDGRGAGGFLEEGLEDGARVLHVAAADGRLTGQSGGGEQGGASVRALSKAANVASRSFFRRQA
jgi:hypothetical protein